MKTTTRLGSLVGAAAVAAAAAAAPASAAPAEHGRPAGGHAVFVQTDDPSGNHIVAYARDADGRLTPAGTYATGGKGGQLAGSVVDHLASQGSLAYDAAHGLLYVVNAGSDTVSVFAVSGDRLALRQVVASGGAFPVSVAVHGDAVYVLNAKGGGSLQGFTVRGGRLASVAAWHHGLGLPTTGDPQFTATPGQVGFSPDGSRLIVTTKAGADSIEVFGVSRSGAIAARPVVTSLPGAVPFAFAFDPHGHLVVAEAGPNAVVGFAVRRDGGLTRLASSPTGQQATCWITPAGGLLFASNAGSGTLSGYRTSSAGGLRLLTTTPTDPGTVDAASADGGRYLYVQTGGSGIIDAFRVNADGSLARIGSETVPNGAGAEGIVAL